jgi:glutaconate CoA-transferase subunit B
VAKNPAPASQDNAPADTSVAPHELLAFTIARLLEGIRHVAVGASSPIPGSGALLARANAQARGELLRVSILGSRQHNSFTNGGVEIFDLAAQGRIDAFFLGGGQIDAQANINLVGVGDYPRHDVRWPGSFGSAYLYHLVPRVILFREEHSRRVFVPRVSFVSAAGPRADATHYRPGGPHALLTNRCLFSFNKDKRRFCLQTLHPGHTLEEIRDETGFEFDVADKIGTTPLPDADTLALMRGEILAQIAETYPRFVSTIAGQ